MDLDLWISKVKEGQHLAEHELQTLCEYVKEILIEESNVQPVNSPVTVCGDIHGQFHDLMKLFATGGHVPETNYIFMGDFVDRGFNSLEVFTILLLLKARDTGQIRVMRWEGRWEWWLLAVEEDPDGEEDGNVAEDEEEALERCGLRPPGRKTIQAQRKMATEAADEHGCTDSGLVVSSPVLQFSGGWRKGIKSTGMRMAGRAD